MVIKQSDKSFPFTVRSTAVHCELSHCAAESERRVSPGEQKVSLWQRDLQCSATIQPSCSQSGCPLTAAPPTLLLGPITLFPVMAPQHNWTPQLCGWEFCRLQAFITLLYWSDNCHGHHVHVCGGSTYDCSVYMDTDSGQLWVGQKHMSDSLQPSVLSHWSQIQTLARVWSTVKACVCKVLCTRVDRRHTENLDLCILLILFYFLCIFYLLCRNCWIRFSKEAKREW